MRAPAGQPPLVGDVDFRGNAHLSTGELRSKIALTRSGSHLIIDLGGKYTFQRGGLRTDSERIVRLYEAHGYYQAKVTDIETHDVDGRMNVTFVVDEGPPVQITAFDVTGLDTVWPETRQVVGARLPVEVGDVFAEAPYEQTKALLVSRLRDNGYLQAEVTGTVEVDTRAQTARVHLSAEPGHQFHVGAITIKGIFDTKGRADVSHERVVDASHLKGGELLTPKVMNTAHDGITALGVFATVDVVPDLTQEPAPIGITLKEAPFQTVETGGGLELDELRELAQVHITYTNKNLGSDLQKLIAGGSLGYAFLPTVFDRQAQGLLASAQVQYIQPRIFRQSIDAQVKLDYTKDILPAVHYQRVGLRPGLNLYLDRVKGLSFVPSINYEYYFSVGAGPTTSPNSVISPLRTTGCGGAAASGVPYSTCVIGYLEGQLNYDLRDNPVEPHKGVFLAFNIQYAGLPLSNFRYIRYAPEARGYIPLTHRFVIALHARYGYLQDLEGNDPSLRPPPIMAHFFAGGANSVRATGTELMGPMTYALETNTAGNANQVPYNSLVPIPIGGDHLLEGSIELRWFTPIENLGIVLFYDAARVWTTNTKDVGFQTPLSPAQFGPGIGLRYKTPLGPIRLDVAYRSSSFSVVPVNVDRSQIINPPKGAAPASPTASDYLISTDCPAHGATPWTCYAVPRINFYLTVGEAF